jgi:hypothetical protein
MGWRVKFTFWDKNAALNALGNHLGMKDGVGKLEVGGTIKVVGGLPDPDSE